MGSLGIAAEMICATRKRSKLEVLRYTGIRKNVIVTDFEFEGHKDGLGYIVCQELENTRKPKTYKSSLISYDYCVKKCPIGSFVPVYVDSKDSGHYFMDTEYAYEDKEEFQKKCEDKKLKKIVETNHVITFEKEHPEETSLMDGWIMTIAGLVLLLIAIFEVIVLREAFPFIGIIAMFLLFIGVFVMLRQKARLRKASRLVRTGLKYQARLQNIKRKDFYGVRGHHSISHKLYFIAQNPITGKEERFKQATFEAKVRKECVESGVVDVYVDPNKPKSTFMDFSSCVLKLKE